MTTPSPSGRPDHTTGRGRRLWWGLIAAAAAAIMLALIGWAGYTWGSHYYGHRDQPMAERASSVMPFDLNATTHSFTITDAGGIQQVVAVNPNDQTNIALIRQHLRYEADQFALSNYADPAAIHGADMPGLEQLQAGAGRLQVHYEQIPSGARIIYSSTEPDLVAALHTWFDAQNHNHSMPGMGMGH